MPCFKKTKTKDINECSLGTHNCSALTNCVNKIGSYECHCKPGYVGDGIECSPCAENFYSFNETTCLLCPENSTSSLASASIFDCKCTSFNHYPDNQTLTCLPCDYGFKVDEILNVCQSIFFFFFFFIFNFFNFLLLLK